MPKLIGYFKNALPVVLLITAVILIFAIPRLIKVEIITCSSQFGPCKELLQLRLADYNHKSLASSKSEIANFLSTNPNVAKFSVRFLLPAKLDINIVERKGEFALASGNDVAIVDLTGLVIGYEKETVLPRIETKETLPRIGSKVTSEQLFALKAVRYMNKLFNINLGGLENSSVLFKVKDGPTLIFPDSGDIEKLVGGSVLVMSGLNSGMDKSKMSEGLKDCRESCTIDLRYTNPVVRLN